MLLGTHEHTIDDKNRLTLPAKFRESFADGLVVARGLERCLQAYRREDWVRLVESRLAPLDPFSQEARKIQRFLFAGSVRGRARQTGPRDDPGAAARSTRSSSREVVVAGMRDHVEIWDREAWGRELAEIEGSAEDVAERLAAKND